MKPRPLWYAAATFWRRVDSSGGPQACWLWTGATDPQGYGQVTVRTIAPHPTKAHRVAWVFAFGDPGELCVLHRCDNPPCCNPAHLFLGTRADNSADMAAKGRSKPSNLKGQEHGNALLNDQAVLVIRHCAHAGVPLARLAALHGVCRANVHRIVAGKSWRHLGGVA